jgi:cbb3-type cytochrome oxidase cytochrome c subunit
MIDIQAKVSAKTIINKKEFEFIFPNNVDIKDTTQALADIHKHLVDIVKEQNEKAKKEAEEKAAQEKSSKQDDTKVD